MGGVKHDSGKPRLELIPAYVLTVLGQVLAFGAKRYGDWNWSEGMAWSRVYAAAGRHLGAWLDGQDINPESGLPHLGHALCNIVFLLVYGRYRIGTDDRHKWPDSEPAQVKTSEPAPVKTSEPAPVKTSEPTPEMSPGEIAHRAFHKALGDESRWEGLSVTRRSAWEVAARAPGVPTGKGIGGSEPLQTDRVEECPNCHRTVKVWGKPCQCVCLGCGMFRLEAKQPSPFRSTYCGCPKLSPLPVLGDEKGHPKKPGENEHNAPETARSSQSG